MTNKEFAASQMGRLVVVTKVLEVDLRPGLGCAHRTWRVVPLDPPRAGWVIGLRWLQEGVVRSLGCDGGGYLEQRARVYAVLVAFWPTERPVPVPEAGLAVVLEPGVELTAPAPHPSRGGGPPTSRPGTGAAQAPVPLADP